MKKKHLLLWVHIFVLASLVLTGCGGRSPDPTTVRIEFSADRSSLAPGECARLNWDIKGGFGVELDGRVVQPGGGIEVCPQSTTTYKLAVDAGERLETRSIEITVSETGGEPAPEPAAPDPIQPSNAEITVVRDLVYDKTRSGGQENPLLLDLYLPTTAVPSPVLVYLHGGGWFEGSKESCPGSVFAGHGYAVACVDYRLAGMQGTCGAASAFPIQIQDAKAAVAWLRTHADEYGLDPASFAAIGDSSGGHLASLLGTSGGESGSLGIEAGSVSDRVQAVVDWFGPVDVTQAPPKVVFNDDPCSTNFGALSEKYGGEAVPYFYWTYAWAVFLGGPLNDAGTIEQARRATPLTYIDPGDPPFLIIHGELDGMVPIEQSALLVTALQNAGVEVTFVRVPEGGHGYCSPGSNGACQQVLPEFLNPTLDFLGKHLTNTGPE